MKVCSYLPVARFIIFFSTITVARGISVSCGSGEFFAASDGTEWIGDRHAKISSLVQVKGSSTVARGSIASADQAMYKAARISRLQFSYVFLLDPGPKCLRLHFNPVLFQGFKGLNDLFTVRAGPFTLLSSFSASLTAAALDVESFAKEFCMSLEDNQPFNVVFYPDRSIHSNAGTYAFINGIEIMSLPVHLSFFHGVAKVVGSESLVHLNDYKLALEIVHRQYLISSDDFVHAYGKTEIPTNKIENSTWKISVDVGFRYLIRVHFSGSGLKMAEADRLRFVILVNEIIADTDVNVVLENGNGLQYKDYMVTIQGHKQEGRRHILISLGSSYEFVDSNGPIRGFEILKLSNFDNTLASPNLMLPPGDSPSLVLRALLRIIDRIDALYTSTIVVLVLVNVIVHWMQQILEVTLTVDKKLSDRRQRLCRHFSLAEIQSATENFNHEFLIGKGGFGKVYKGLIDGGKQTVAVKRLKYSSSQGESEFLTEIETLSELRHINIVTLIGYCNELGEMILVYEFADCGTLDHHLYKRDLLNVPSPSLSWKQRLNICIEVSRGLDYLHTGHGIIHHDVKSSNILLDKNFVAKVSDFGLAKRGVESTLQSHLSKNVMGTPGYMDPFILKTHFVTAESDIYAFGVVLLEIISGRPVIDPKAEKDKNNLVTWARESISKGEISKILSSDLRGQIPEDSLKAFVEVAESCLDDEPKKRPMMAQVVSQLHIILEQQDKPTSWVPKDIGVFGISPFKDGTIIAGSSEKLITDLPNKQTESAESSNGLNNVRNQWDASISGVISSQIASGYVMDSGSKTHSSSLPQTTRIEDGVSPSSNLKSFTFSDLMAATRNFNRKGILGIGNFGPVYKGQINQYSDAASRPSSGMMIVVKRLNQERWQEWQAEIDILGRILHHHVVKLIGYCLENDQRLLVYEFMEKGSMDMHLFGRGAHCESLSWSQRMKIALGAARGLAFLHTAETNLIYRNFKTSNILIDSNYNAKLTDFWLAREGPVADESHLSTRDAGGGEYVCPEYLSTGQLTAKTDVYSFGMVLLEILTGKRATDKNHPFNFRHLVGWKSDLTNKRKIFPVLDTRLEGQYALDQAVKTAKLSLQCLSENARSRPSMDEVVTELEKLQNWKAN